MNEWRVTTTQGPEWVKADLAEERDGSLLFFVEDDSHDNLVAAFNAEVWLSMQMDIRNENDVREDAKK